MRNPLFHPLLLYPALALAAVALIFLSLRPDLGIMTTSAQAGRYEEGVVVLEGEALAHPEVSPGMFAHVARDGLGRPIGLRVAAAPDQGEPDGEDRGVRILLTPEAAARLPAGPAIVEVLVRPVPVTTAPALAVSLQGEGPVAWARQDLPPEPRVVRFAAPSGAGMSAVGLRPISAYADYNYGFEIGRIRILPATASPR